MDVVILEELERFVDSLEPKVQERIVKVFMLLAEQGRLLREPYSKSLEDTQHPGYLRELRVSVGAAYVIRIIYWIDELSEEAILLNGFNKKGKDDRRLYKKMITEAEALYNGYRALQESEQLLGVTAQDPDTEEQ